MPVSRRKLLSMAGSAAALASLQPARLFAAEAAAGLVSMTTGIAPIGRDEYQARIARARDAHGPARHRALVIEPGSSMVYFTGVQWWRSERLTAAILPRDGDIAIVTPHFEEPSVRESLRVPADVRVWNEDEDPLVTVAGVLRDRKVAGPIAVEETVRFFAVDALRRAMPRVDIVNGAAVVRGCRMVKSAAELALMQKAADVTVAAYRHTAPRIRAGMAPGDIAAMMNAAHEALGATPEFALILLGEASAYPHGSSRPQTVRDGEVVLMDCGCTVQGYQSDISRTFVFGGATRDQRNRVAAGARRPADRDRSRAHRRGRRPGGRCRARAIREVGLRPGVTNYPASRTGPATASASTVTSR
jgi:Xaa-Pro dipeptidase